MKKEKIFRIGWDGDGVLIESYWPVLARVNEILGTTLVKSDLTNWNAVGDIAQNITGDKEFASRLLDTWHDPDVLRQSPPNQTTLEVFRRCLDLPKTEQFVITTRRPTCTAITQEWLEENLAMVDWSSRLFIRQVGSTMGGDEFKVATIKSLGVNIMFDDNTDTITLISNEVPECRLGYLTHPWNQSDMDPVRGKMRVPFDDSNILYNKIIEVREQFFAR